MGVNLKYYETTHFQNLKELTNECTTKFKNNVAFMVKNKKGEIKNITYVEFKKDIDGLGTELINMGLKGKRIAIIANNCYEWVVSYLAVMNGVGIVVPLDKGLPTEEIVMSLERSKADAVIYDEKHIENMKIVKEKNQKIKHYISIGKVEDSNYEFRKLITKGKESIKKGNKEYIDAEIADTEMGAIIFTSGTTSKSKAVMLSHRNIAENVYSLNCREKIYDTDVSLAFLPLHHTFGSTAMLFFLSNGAANAFCEGLRHIQKNMKEFKVSVFVGVPLLLEGMHKKIMQEVEKQGKTKLIKTMQKVTGGLNKIGIDIRRKVFKTIIDSLGGHVRFVVSGAAAIDKQVAKDFNSFGILTVQGYGLTETAPVLAAEDEKNIKYGSIGLPMENVEIKINNPNEEGIGELIAKGPNVMLGYYEDEEATNEVLKDGWFYTGDLGYKDKDGFIFITGRKKNVIVLKNGKNIYPEEIELQVNNLRYVAESMVFGTPKGDDLTLSAKIVYSTEYEEFKTMSKEEIEQKIWEDIKALNQGFPNYKHIKKIIVTDEPMVKTTTQKIKRFEEIKKMDK